MPPTITPTTVQPSTINTAPQTASTMRVAGPLVQRAFTRSPLVDRTLKQQKKDAIDGGASYSRMHAANAKLEKFEFSYHTGLCKQANVLTPPPADQNGKRILDLTMCVNVSGHNQDSDPTSVHSFAKANTYAVRVVLPDGQEIRLSNVPRSKTPEYSTAIDLSFELQKGKTIVEAWPEGSAGVGGYVEGRRYELNYGDKLFKSSWKPSDDVAGRESLQPYVEA